MIGDNRIPTWKECDLKYDNGEAMTALERFIYDNEPAGAREEKMFRDALASVLLEVAGDF